MYRRMAEYMIETFVHRLAVHLVFLSRPSFPFLATEHLINTLVSLSFRQLDNNNVRNTDCE